LGPRIAGMHIIGNPFDVQEMPASFQVEPLFTHSLDLGQGFESVQQNFSEEKKRGIKKAARQDVQVRLAQTEQDFLTYYEIYQDTLRRWGQAALFAYPWELFRSLQQQDRQAVKLWLASVNGVTACGKIMFYHNRFAVYWHGASLEAYLKTNVDAYLMSQIIRHACESGYSMLDFGASGGLKGVEQYKERYGAMKTPFYSYNWQNNRLHAGFKRLLYFTAKNH